MARNGGRAGPVTHETSVRKQFAAYAAAGAIALVASAWTAGGHQPPADARSTTAAAQPGVSVGPVDSLLAMPELLRRFRSGLAPVSSLANGAASRDELVALFISAVERNDTMALARLAVSRAEYAYLYFPSSPYMGRPYGLPPDVAWMLSTAASEKGINRVLGRLGGHRLEYSGYDCAGESREGSNRFWRDCRTDYTHPGDGRVSRRLFGTIIEHGGAYKFLTYANDF